MNICNALLRLTTLVLFGTLSLGSATVYGRKNLTQKVLFGASRWFE